MATQKKVSENGQRKITIIFGYGLFVAALAAVIVSTVIPLSRILLNPVANRLNVTAMLITFVAAAIIPFLVAYIIGDRTTRAKNKVTHHYNGILFAVMAYWLTLLFSFIGPFVATPIRQVIPAFWMLQVVNTWPVLLTIIIIAIIAFSYHARKKKEGTSVLQYRPYQFVLLVSLVAPLILNLSQIAGGYLLTSLLNIGVPAIFIGISYIALRKIQPLKQARLTHAIIAFTFGIVSMQFAAQLVINLPVTTVFTALAMTAVGVAVWVLYLWLSVHATNKTK
jgi:MFS family permease